jgi:hypothetical protein
VERERGVVNEIAGLTSRTLPGSSSGRGKGDSRTVDAGRKADVLRTGAVEAAHLGSEGEVSEEAVGTSPDAARTLGVSSCPSGLSLLAQGFSRTEEAEMLTKRALKAPKV